MLIANSGMTYAQVCAQAGNLNPVKLSRYVNLREPIASQHLLSLSNVFDCEPEDLIGRLED